MKAKAEAALPLDAGNALFAEATPPDAKAKDRAALILEAMASMGVQVMGVGARDLSAGVDFLQTTARKHGVTPLSANLVRGGKPLFEASKVVTVNGITVGVIGASAPTTAGGAVTARPLLESVAAEARRLRPQVDLVVVLGAVPYADALQLAGEGAVDLVLQNHDQRGIGPGVPIPMGNGFVIHTGERGRQVAQLELSLTGKGRLSDANQGAREKQSLEILDRQIGEVQKRIERAEDPKVKKSYQATLESFRTRRKDVEKRLQTQGPAGNTLKLTYTTLGPNLPSDPALEARVAKVAPEGHAH